jgi:hypothetical protein
MIQAGLGGYNDIVNSQETLDNSPVFYEPGYNIMFPLEISVPPADQVYMLIRERLGEDTFRVLSVNDFTITTKDATTGESIPSLLGIAKSYNSSWDPDGTVANPEQLVAIITDSISADNPIDRVRVLDVVVNDIVNDYFINFRLTIDDENKLFYYIPVNLNNIRNRDKFSSVGRVGVVPLQSSSDTYLLISPFSTIYESVKEDSDFSYPIGTIFYKRQKGYNEEDFTFKMGEVSHSFVSDSISLMNIPNYDKAALLVIDRYLYTNLSQTSEVVSMSIVATGVLSGIESTFTMKFKD